MTKDVTRTHIVVADELIAEVDGIAGKRKRSRFVEEAIREKLARRALADALEASAGVLARADYPEWGRPEDVSAWVRAGRQDDNARLARKLGTAPGSSMN